MSRLELAHAIFFLPTCKTVSPSATSELLSWIHPSRVARLQGTLGNSSPQGRLQGTLRNSSPQGRLQGTLGHSSPQDRLQGTLRKSSPQGQLQGR